MLDENLLEILEQKVRQDRDLQHRLEARLREAEDEVELLRRQIRHLDDSAAETEKYIDNLLLAARSGGRTLRERSTSISDDTLNFRASRRNVPSEPTENLDFPIDSNRRLGSVSYIHQNRGIPSITSDPRPVSNRFSDRTITQACRLLLREAGTPLHVNELYNMLVAGGMQFRGNNPTISIAVSLNRNRQFRKVDPGTFDLVMREAIQAVS